MVDVEIDPARFVVELGEGQEELAVRARAFQVEEGGGLVFYGDVAPGQAAMEDSALGIEGGVFVPILALAGGAWRRVRAR